MRPSRKERMAFRQLLREFSDELRKLHELGPDARHEIDDMIAQGEVEAAVALFLGAICETGVETAGYFSRSLEKVEEIARLIDLQDAIVEVQWVRDEGLGPGIPEDEGFQNVCGGGLLGKMNDLAARGATPVELCQAMRADGVPRIEMVKVLRALCGLDIASTLRIVNSAEGGREG